MDFYKFDDYCFNELTISEERIYRTILSFKNRLEKYAYPSQEKIAEKSKLSIATVKRAIKKLVEKNFIRIEKMKKRLGHYNKYELLVVPEVQQKKIEKEPVMDSNDFDDIDNLLVQEEPKNANSELIESKTGLKLTDWEKYIANIKMKKTLILQTITLFKKKKGIYFALFKSLYSDLLAARGELTQDIKDTFILDDCIIPAYTKE